MSTQPYLVPTVLVSVPTGNGEIDLHLTMGIVSQLANENDEPEDIKTLKLFVDGKF
jgi:hypothetical protein